MQLPSWGKCGFLCFEKPYPKHLDVPTSPHLLLLSLPGFCNWLPQAPSSSRTECFRQWSQKIPTTKSPNEGLISTVCPKERILDPQKRCEVLKACWKRCRDGKPWGPGEQRKPYRSPSFLMWLLGEEGWLPGINTQGREGGKEIYFRCKFTCVKRKRKKNVR